MHSYLVAVVDGAHARFFTFTTAEFSEAEPTPHLLEHSSLNNADKPMAIKGTKNNIGRKHHGHRHEKTTQSEEINRRFANKVTQQVSSILENWNGHHLILVAEPHILGNLRDSLPSQITSRVSVHELAKDLCRLSTHELQKYLEGKQLLPNSKTSR
ncbi:MAG: host attachment protein [Cyanobacteria bacterium P01_D01_bin.156]